MSDIRQDICGIVKALVGRIEPQRPQHVLIDIVYLGTLEHLPLEGLEREILQRKFSVTFALQRKCGYKKESCLMANNPHLVPDAGCFHNGKLGLNPSSFIRESWPNLLREW